MRNPQLWDTARIGGVITPGQVEITGGVSPRKWDVWGGYGLSGAATVFTGIDIKDFGMRIMMWEAEQYDQYMATIVPLLDLPPRGTRPKALSFFHPAVSLPPLRIRSVGIKEPGQPYQDDKGLWWVDIKLIPYQQPKPGLAKPIAADDTKPKPQDKLGEKILALTDEIQKYSKP
jgi:hypothetical protein